MKYLILALLLLTCLTINPVAKASGDFNAEMKVWNENIELASKYLKIAEKEFLNGDELQGCVEQRKAAEYGILATNSLIKAFEISGSTDDLSGILSGLSKWKELRDFCG